MANIQKAPGQSLPFVDAFPIPLLSSSNPTSATSTYPLGQLWINTVSGNIFTLTSAGGTKTWSQTAAGAAASGQATLVSGTVTVANTNIAATDLIFLSRADENSSTALGALTVTAITAGTSFVITALNTTTPASTVTGDVSIVNYFIVPQI